LLGEIAPAASKKFHALTNSFIIGAAVINNNRQHLA
jgi:hypothetical protein